MKRERSEVIRTIRKVLPTVVSIVISKDHVAVERELADMDPKKKNGRKPGPDFQIPADRIDAEGMVEVGGGSGFLVDPGGIVLTNKHVIAEPNARYTVVGHDGAEYPAEVLARDPMNDVAILKIKPPHPLEAIALGDSAHLELGQTVLAIGNALGLFKNTVSMGIVSGLSRSVSAQADPGAPPQELRGLIQTDAAINPGNSGGPLVDIFGRAVGINAAVVYGAQNINFAIPIHAAGRDLADLKEYGRIRRPLLGLRYLTVNHAVQGKFKLPVDYGALVTKEHPFDSAVIPGSPAAVADIREGDIVLEWDGKRITPEKNLQDCLETAEVGEEVPLTVLRDGKTFSATVRLAERK